MKFNEDNHSVVELGYDPASNQCYPTRENRLDAKILVNQDAKVLASQDISPPEFSEDGFVRIGPGRHFKPEAIMARDNVIPVTSEPIKRMNSDGRRPHRAQPTRRACNSR